MVFLVLKLSRLGVCERLAFWEAPQYGCQQKQGYRKILELRLCEGGDPFYKWTMVCLDIGYRRISQQRMDDDSNLFSKTCTSRSKYIVDPTSYALSERSRGVWTMECIGLFAALWTCMDVLLTDLPNGDFTAGRLH
jgi:hypothetical protein